MSEKLLVTHCSPTLAGLKTGNLFSCSCSRNQLNTITAMWNSMLNPKGVYIKVMRFRNGTALIYVYRRQKLINDIRCRHVSCFLEKAGYDCRDLDKMLERLSHRLCKYEDFPHEIGVFLGYPFEDVKGFIENKGRNYKHAGIWKVYSDESSAIRLFSKYKKCTEVYCQRLQEGTCLLRLTVEGRHLA